MLKLSNDVLGKRVHFNGVLGVSILMVLRGKFTQLLVFGGGGGKKLEKCSSTGVNPVNCIGSL